MIVWVDTSGEIGAVITAISVVATVTAVVATVTAVGGTGVGLVFLIKNIFKQVTRHHNFLI